MRTGRMMAVALALVVAGMCWGRAAGAQGMGGMGGMKGKGMGGGQIAQELGLTQDQKDKLQALRQQFAPKRRELMQAVKNGAITREEAAKQTKAMAQEFQQKAAGILTPEQMEKAKSRIQELLANRRERGGQGQGERGAMLKELNLTADQKEAMKTAMQAHRQGMQALRDQVQAGTITQDQMKEKAKALRQDMIAALKAKLTPEQLQKVQEMMSERKGKGMGGGMKGNKGGQGAGKKE